MQPELIVDHSIIAYHIGRIDCLIISQLFFDACKLQKKHNSSHDGLLVASMAPDLIAFFLQCEY